MQNSERELLRDTARMESELKRRDPDSSSAMWGAHVATLVFSGLNALAFKSGYVSLRFVGLPSLIALFTLGRLALSPKARASIQGKVGIFFIIGLMLLAVAIAEVVWAVSLIR